MKSTKNMQGVHLKDRKMKNAAASKALKDKEELTVTPQGKIVMPNTVKPIIKATLPAKGLNVAPNGGADNAQMMQMLQMMQQIIGNSQAPATPNVCSPQVVSPP